MRFRLLMIAGLLVGAATGLARPRAEGQDMLVLVGTYTGPKSRGIYAFDFDTTTGTMTPRGLAAEARNPSFLAVHPNGRFVYAVNEVDDFEGDKAGSVSAFALDADTGRLTLLNTRSSRGGAPCHLTVNRTGRFVLVANYHGGNVAVLPIGADGRLGDAAAVVQHTGSSILPRQTQPHAHNVILDAADRIAIVADLGIDQLRLYRFDPESGALEPHEQAFVASHPGSGPRHFTFHPDNARGFAINELASTITVYGYDPRRPTLEIKQTISTLPEGWSGSNTTAEVQAHMTGRFVFGSNRGHDSIAVFAMIEHTGRLGLVEHASTRGRTPRHFAQDPRGNWLIAANQESDSLAIFRIDRLSGHLTPVGDPVPTPSPVCVKFIAK